MPQYPWVDTEPFRMETASHQVACLLLHGFAGSPSEVRPLAERLSAKGVPCFGPRLVGHGLRPEALQNIDWEDWVNGASEVYRELLATYDHVVVVGLSMGSLVACLMTQQLAQDLRPAGLVLMAPALRARDNRLKWAPKLRFVLPWFPETNRPQAGLTNPEGWKKLWHYERRPVHALAELHHIQQAASKVLHEIEVPVLVIHGLKDQTVPDASAREVYERLGSRKKELLWLENSGHCLTADVEIDRVFEEVFDFIQSCLKHPGEFATARPPRST